MTWGTSGQHDKKTLSLTWDNSEKAPKRNRGGSGKEARQCSSLAKPLIASRLGIGTNMGRSLDT